MPTSGGATAAIAAQMPPPCKDWDMSNNEKVEVMYLYRINTTPQWSMFVMQLL